MIFKRVGDGRPYPDHELGPRDWAALPPRPVRLDELVTTKDTLQLAALLDEDSTFFGDLFAHVVEWRDDLYLEDGLHRALRAALQQRHVLHARVHVVHTSPTPGWGTDRRVRTQGHHRGHPGGAAAGAGRDGGVRLQAADRTAAERSHRRGDLHRRGEGGPGVPEAQARCRSASSTPAAGKGFAGETLEKFVDAGFARRQRRQRPQERRGAAGASCGRPTRTTRRAKLVATSLGPATKIEVTETDLGPGVDVIVGNKFKGLERKAPKRIRLADPVEKCMPVD